MGFDQNGISRKMSDCNEMYLVSLKQRKVQKMSGFW